MVVKSYRRRFDGASWSIYLRQSICQIHHSSFRVLGVGGNVMLFSKESEQRRRSDHRYLADRYFYTQSDNINFRLCIA